MRWQSYLHGGWFGLNYVIGPYEAGDNVTDILNQMLKRK